MSLTGSFSKSSSHSFSTASTNDKYQGLLDIPPATVFRQTIVKFYQYLRDARPPTKVLFNIVGAWEMLNFFLSSLFLNNTILYPDGKVLTNFMRYIAIFQRFSSAGSRQNLFFYFGLVYDFTFVIMILILVFSCQIIKKTNKVPSAICFIYTEFCDGLVYIFFFSGFALAGHQAGIKIGDEVDGNGYADIIIFVVFYIFWIYQLNMDHKYENAFLSFRFTFNNPFDTVTNIEFRVFLHMTIFFSSLLGNIRGMGVFLCYAVIVILDVIFIVRSIMIYEFAKIMRKSVFITLPISGLVNTIVQMYFIITKKDIPEIIIALEIVLFLILFLIINLLISKKNIATLHKLDLMAENMSSFDEYVKKPRDALLYMQAGFRIAHPAIISNDFTKVAVEKFPDNYDILLLWARFCTAFPSETKTLAYLEEQLKKLKKKGRLSTLRAEIKLVVHQREANLSPTFKKNLNKINHLSATARNCQRRFWESVIQGNLTDMETAALATQKSVYVIDTEIMHLVRLYPNNQYIAREYSKYLLKIRGDVIGFSFWHQNYLKLKGGQNIVDDKSEKEAKDVFPILNDLIKEPLSDNRDLSIQRFMDSSVSSSTTRSIVFEPADLADDGIFASIRSSIMSISFPIISLSYILIAFFGTIVIFICAPITTAVIVQSIQKSADILSAPSYIVSLAINSLHMTVIPARRALNATGIINWSEENERNSEEDSLPLSFGNSTNPNVQMGFFIQNADQYLKDLKSLYEYVSVGQETIDIITSLMFEPTNTFHTFTIVNYPDDFIANAAAKSIDAAITYQGILANQILGSSDIASTLKTYEFPTMFDHTSITYLGLMEIIDLFIDFYSDNNDFVMKIITILLPVILVLLFILMLGVNIPIYLKQKETTHLLMHCFLTIPKQTASEIVQSMKIHGKAEDLSEEDTNEDNEVVRNKHEENMLATLSSSGDKTMSLNLALALSIGIVSLFIVGAAQCIFVYFYVQEPIKSLIITATQTHNIGFSYAALLHSYLDLFRVGAIDFGFPFAADKRGDLLDSAIFYMKEYRNHYTYSKIGEPDPYIAPLALVEPNSYKTLFSPHSSDCNYSKMADFHEFVRCRSIDSLFSMMEFLLCESLSHLKNNNTGFDVFANLERVWDIGSKHIFDQTISKEMVTLPNTAYYNYKFKKNMLIMVVLLLSCLSFIIVLLVFVAVAVINKRLKWFTEMLMHVPPDTLLASKAIVAILSGNQTEKERKTASLTDAFYKSVIEKFLDAVLFVDKDLKITQTNPAAERIFGSDPLGKNFDDLNFTHNEKLDNLNQTFNQIRAGNFSGTGKNSQSVKISSADGASVYLSVSITTINNTAGVSIKRKKDGKTSDGSKQIESFIVVVRDITQTRRSEKLLKEERARSDSLLRHILPPVIVDGLQRGEKDISFFVPSASVLFMDIVEFTPWCASLQASQVMSTLNLLFKEFDMSLSQYPTMTKIKCIGDCYMAAGGIFETDNQPKIHAAETVRFGVDSIHDVLKINNEIDQKLRIRCGINTGGPLAAGVLGVDRPTFEILGPVINMAQQMEHHGVPMMVHISPSVYEQIYGGDFKIKERGEVEVKSGKIVTYLVDPM